MKRNSKEITRSIIAGLEDATLHAKGRLKLRETVYDVSPIPNFRGKEIRLLRQNLELTQLIFARTLGVSLKTVEAWESGRNIPQGPAQRMLEILRHKPSVLKEVKIVKQR